MLETAIDSRMLDLSRKYSLQPLFLQKIILLRSQGFNNTEIAEKTGISRVTVNTYIEQIKQMESEDLIKLILLVVVAAAGIALIKELFGNNR